MAELTHRVSTNVAAPEPNAHVPMNQFGHMAKYPTAADKDIVRLNVDTLYSFAFLDLTQGPMVLSVPDTKGRYYLMPLVDAWTNVFASPGKRTTGTNAGNFLVSGPAWSGSTGRVQVADQARYWLAAARRRTDPSIMRRCMRSRRNTS